MKIINAINTVDALQPNTYEQSRKVEWLSTLDAMIKREIIDTHEGGEGCTFAGYGSGTDIKETELLATAPHDIIYLRWLEAQIHYHNGENDKYNNAINAFNTAYAAYRNYYNRTHMPKGNKFQFF